jgi:hypothetical protein
MGEVTCHNPLHLKCGLSMVYFGQLGLDGRSLTGEFASLVHGLVLNVYLSSTGSRLLLLLVGF